MNPVRIALIGCGSIAEKHVNAMHELGESVALVALCDIDKHRLERFAEQTCNPHFPHIRLFVKVEELLSMSDVDLIVIATSSDTHAQLTITALRAGKHVLVEKPLSLSLQEARTAAAEAEKRRLILAVSFQARYLTQIQAIKQAVTDGSFGRLMHGHVSMRWNRNMDYYMASPWRDSWTKGGGLFMNQCIHYIDLLLWLMGLPESVYAEASTASQPLHVENTGAVVLTFRNGAIGLIEASTAVYPRSLNTSLSLFGSNGSVSLEGERLNELKDWHFKHPRMIKKDEIQLDETFSHTPLYKDLVQAIGTGQSPLVSVETTMASLETVLAIYKSIATGAKVQLPLDGFDMCEMSLNGVK